MQIEEELERIKELTGTDSISDSLDLLHQEAIRRIEACEKEYDTIGLYKKYFLLMHPIGSLYFSTSEVNPETIYGGKWESYASGKILVCVDQADMDFDQADKMGGQEIVSHAHMVNSHVHNLSHTHNQFEQHTHSYNHSHEVRATHAHTMEHQHKIPIHIHTAKPHQHVETQTSISGDSIKISKPKYGQLYHTSFTSAYWLLSKQKDFLAEGDSTTTNDVEQTKENSQIISSYANQNTTSDAIHTLYSNEELLYSYQATEDKHDIPIDKYGNIVSAVEESENWSGPCTMDGQALQSTKLSTLQPYITCYMFKRIE